MKDDDMLNETGKELADALGMTQGELLSGLKSTQYNLAWMKVENASLEQNERGLDEFNRSLGRAYKGMVESLSEALEYNDIQRMEGALKSIDTNDAGKLLEAVRILEQIGTEGLVDATVEGYGTPDVHVETMDEAVELGQRLRKAKASIESTDIHRELSN